MLGKSWKKTCFSPPARWGLLDFMSVACSSPPLLSSSSCSTATLDAQCSLSDLNHDHPRPVFPAGPQPRPSPPSVPCRTSTTTIHAQCSLPDLNREYPRQVFPAGPHVGRYGTKNVQKKVRKNVRQVCYILLANSRVCGRVTGAMPLLTLQVAKFEAISLNRWQSHWGGQRHFHFCTFGAVCKDAWDRQHFTASYYKLLEVISCWIDAWDSQHHTGFHGGDHSKQSNYIFLHVKSFLNFLNPWLRTPAWRCMEPWCGILERSCRRQRSRGCT